ncbi:SapC family protein [uncultured Paraglaciecola sp.]|uniref:SapC family protein n=1 Tax=uncultured Paraglaciecola sp. TaxID=1765024 RepID=UPI0026304ADD|nr:SapC family protein [uncultured Paraglaciecola sp.]
MTNINMIPLDPVKHKNLRINVDRNYSHVSHQNMTALLASEFLQASTNFPIVFVKQPDTGKFKSVALLGLDSEENVVFANNKIHSNYIPINIRRYPFAAGAKNAKEDEMILCIDENSRLLNEKEGVEIFDENGKPSAATNQVTTMLTDILAKDAATDIFIEFLVENDLLQAAEVKLTLGEEGERKLNGLYKVDEEALNELDDDEVLTLYKRKYFPAIYAHLASLSQFQRLLQLKSNFTPE